MVVKVFISQLILVQIISADFARDSVDNNVQSKQIGHLQDRPLAVITRSKRQINSAPVGLTGNGNLPIDGLGTANGLPFNNGMTFGNFPRSNGLLNRFTSSNGLPFTPNVLANFNVPVNGLQNFNGPAGNKFVNINNLPAANILPDINNVLVQNTSPTFNNLPNGNLLPLNNLPINNRLPNMNNIQITGFGIGNDLANLKNFALISGANNFQFGNGFPRINNLQNSGGYASTSFPINIPQLGEASSINNMQSSNAFSGLNNMPFGNELTNNVPVNNGFINFNNVPVDSIEKQNVNNMILNNDIAGNNFQASNMMPMNEQQLVNTNPFIVAKRNPVNTGTLNSWPAKAISNDIASPNTMMNNGGYINERLFAANKPELCSENAIGNGFLSNNLQFGNLQMPGNNWANEFVDVSPVNQILLSERSPMVTNVPSDWQSILTNNNFNLGQDLLNNFRMEGFGNFPMINGLPVAGITETVTVLNSPCN